MRFLALLLLATSIIGADVRPLGPAEDLPFCRVVENEAASIDQQVAVDVAHDGWYCAGTHQIFPLHEKDNLLGTQPLDPRRIVSVTPASAQPGRMPASYRKAVNDFIAKNHPKAPEPAARATGQ